MKGMLTYLIIINPKSPARDSKTYVSFYNLRICSTQEILHDIQELLSFWMQNRKTHEAETLIRLKNYISTMKSNQM